MKLKLKKIVFYIILILIIILCLRLTSMFFTGDLVFSYEIKTKLEGQWVSDKEKTLKFFEKEMGYLKNHLGKLKYTFNGSQFFVGEDENFAIMYFNVIKEQGNEITIQTFHQKVDFLGNNIFLGYISSTTFVLENDCLLPKQSTEYFCK